MLENGNHGRKEGCNADDMVLIARNKKSLKENLEVFRRSLERINIKINQTKIKTVVTGQKETAHKI